MKLNKKQTTALDYLEGSKITELLFGGGAGGGKSLFGCYWILKNCLKYPGSRWVIGRSKLKTLKATTLVSFFEVCKMQGIKTGVHFNYNQQANEIHFFNGSVILLKDLFLYPSDPQFDELGSLEITGAFVDEVNQIVKKAWYILQSRIRYKIDEFKLVPTILGTCNPSKNWVYSTFYKPSKNGKLKPYQQFIKALVTDNPFISKHYIDQLKKLDKNSQERLLRGSWEYDDDPAKLFEIEKIQDMFTNKAVEAPEKYISVDVARFGNDSTVITVWTGLRGVVHRFSKLSTAETAKKVIDFAEKEGVPRSNIIIDEDGIGGGVVDQIPGAKGFLNNGRAIQPHGSAYDETLKVNYSNLKTQCAFKLAELVRLGKVEIVCDEGVQDLIVEEFEQVKEKDIDKDGRIALVGKDKIKEAIGRSPDFFDAIMMRMYFELEETVDLEYFEL